MCGESQLNPYKQTGLEQQNEYLCNSSVSANGKVSQLCLKVFNGNKPTCCTFNTRSEMVKHSYLIKKQISALLIKNSENKKQFNQQSLTANGR